MTSSNGARSIRLFSRPNVRFPLHGQNTRQSTTLMAPDADSISVMSQGLGTTQRQILGHLTAGPLTPAELAKRHYGVAAPSRSNLETVKRALHALELRGEVTLSLVGRGLTAELPRLQWFYRDATFRGLPATTLPDYAKQPHNGYPPKAEDDWEVVDREERDRLRRPARLDAWREVPPLTVNRVTKLKAEAEALTALIGSPQRRAGDWRPDDITAAPHPLLRANVRLRWTPKEQSKLLLRGKRLRLASAYFYETPLTASAPVTSLSHGAAAARYLVGAKYSRPPSKWLGTSSGRTSARYTRRNRADYWWGYPDKKTEKPGKGFGEPQWTGLDAIQSSWSWGYVEPALKGNSQAIREEDYYKALARKAKKGKKHGQLRKAVKQATGSVRPYAAREKLLTDQLTPEEEAAELRDAQWAEFERFAPLREAPAAPVTRFVAPTPRMAKPLEKPRTFVIARERVAAGTPDYEPTANLAAIAETRARLNERYGASPKP